MKDCRRLVDKVAIVTGAAQGLGEALAHRLGKEGACVAIADINDEGAEAVAEAIAEEHGVKTLWAHADVTDLSQTEAAVKKTVDTLGHLDIVISNAGVVFSGAITEIDPARWRAVVDVNLLGYFNVARAAVPALRENGGGVIIQINSKSGKKGSYKNSAYAASKFGGIGLTQSLALELAEDDIRVNAICPGNLLDSPLWVDSLYSQYAKRWGITEEEVRTRYVEQVPMKRGCTYEDIANVMVFLASDESTYMTGQAINVTGGQEMD
ncbi:MAG: sorbitol-6-phosphate dehydrogenase [Chloroflexota bacterium]|nr:sorbitol-6-phosphate dehydrogenase [Chloroflexota bacterium]